MIHNLKMPDGTIEAVDCKLGSGIVDRNGKEIFEGDKVKFWARSRKNDGTYEILSTKVVFDDGALWLYIAGRNYLQSCPPYRNEKAPLFDRGLLHRDSKRMEIVND